MNIKKCGFSSTSQTHSKDGYGDILKVDACDISVIKFEGYQVRIVSIQNEPWFIATDICKALEHSNTAQATRLLDSDERMTISLSDGHSKSRGGARKWLIASESGFYKLISRSRKATVSGTFAHRFTNWVFREVIPSIRKTGGYGVPWGDLQDFSRRNKHSITKGSKAGSALAHRRYEKERLAREESQLWRKYQPDLLAEVSQ